MKKIRFKPWLLPALLIVFFSVGPFPLVADIVDSTMAIDLLPENRRDLPTRLAQAPPHLDILVAGIEEELPIDSENVSDRTVILRIKVAGQPICGTDTQDLSYGFFIDADKSNKTGVLTRALLPLGIDAQITAICDPTLGFFVNPVAPVIVATDQTTQETTLEIPLTVGLLPSVDFHWIAFAMEGQRLTRLPESGSPQNQRPNYAEWGTFEIDFF